MPKLILTIGTSCAGKSSWAKEYADNNPNTVVISRDMFRFGYLTDATNWAEYNFQACEKAVTYHLLLAYEEAIAAGKDVIVADTNLSYVARHRWLMRSFQDEVSVEYVVFNTAFEQMFSDSSTILSLPDYVLHKQYPMFKEFLSEKPKHFVKYTIV